MDSTVRTYAQTLGQTGYEYGLGGTPTGVTYTNTVGCCFRDGTTDGVHNYASSDAGLFQFNTDWTNPQLLGSGSDIGIAYDRTSDSFWYAGGVLIYNVNRTGDILNAFYLNHSVSLLTRALALDPVDHTLWLFNYVPFASYFEQYSTAANPPGAVTKAPLSTLFVGSKTYVSAEFALNPNAGTPGGNPIPEPGSVALMLIGLLGLAASRRRVESL